MSNDADTAMLSIDQGVSNQPVFERQSEALIVTLAPERARFSLRVKPDHRVALVSQTGIALPAKIGETIIDGDDMRFCLGPDEWLLISPIEMREERRKGFQEAAKTIPFSFVDISHRNVGVSIAGALAARVLNTGCPLDLSLERFPVGKATRTVFERAQIVLFREAEQTFYVELWRSFAPYFLGLIEKAAAEWS